MLSGILVSKRLLENPGSGVVVPLVELLGLEPEGNLLLGVLNGVGAVADVAAHVLLVFPLVVVLAQIDRKNEEKGKHTRAKSPRMVPGAEARGLVAPRMVRPVLTASLPSQTMAQMGPEFMYLMRPAKKGLVLRSS